MTYPDAFTDFKADLVCTYRRGGFECDLVFRQQPPTPDQYGLDSSFSTLQLVTEFFNTADPQEIPAQTDDWFGLQDTTLKFGKLTMTHGRAFGVKAQNSPSPAANATTPVYKTWTHIAGRTFLIEEVPLAYIADDLDTLPEATNALSSKVTGSLRMTSNRRQMPLAPESIISTNQMLMASAEMNKNPGVVLDYNEVDADQNDDFTLAANTTYYVSGYVNFNGAVTFGPGAVVKFPEDGSGGMYCNGDIVCETTPDAPAILTSVNDDSVGDIISGVSTGTPAVGGANYLMQWGNSPLKNLRFYYAGYAVMQLNPEIWNAEFHQCSVAVDTLDVNIYLYNVLFDHCDMFEMQDVYTGAYVWGNNVTVDNCQWFWPDWPQGLLMFTNSIFSNDGGVERSVFSGMGIGWTLSGNSIGTYNTYCYASNLTQAVWCSDQPFVTGGNACFYLKPGYCFKNFGTTNIDSDLLAELQTMTTYAPQDGGFPDTNGTDLGYHYPVNEDSDHDGLPDAWEWHWFGNYTHTGSQLDSSAANTLLYDYEHGLDPNVIQFSLAATNDYVNHTNVLVQLDIIAGTPSYYAVHVNQTATTNWLAFTTTNLNVNLGYTDGVYNVSIGLRGLPAEATETWESYIFTLDRVKPVLAITNPILAGAAATVIKPYLQLQGFADEPLASLSYDISNAFGLATNLDAFVKDQALATTTNIINSVTNIFYDFTTNFFQAYDVPLATNENVITLRVTDRAGNTTTTNFNVTLDYTGATNPPVVTLIWPQDGMAVSGTNLTVRGTMSDETGGIVAQVVNGDGTTNTITGLMERNGMFWIENVPLNGETEISLQATDAAGNVTVTNLTVEPSALVLTITGTPMGDDLWHGAGMVYGTVSDGNATVTVNGTNAVVDDSYANDDGTYNWTATNAPISGQGTATFDATAWPGQSSFSSHLRSMSMNTVTPGTPPANVSLAVEMQPYVAMISYNGAEVQKYTALDYGYAWYRQTVKNQTAQPTAGTSGQWVLNDRRVNSMYWYEQEGSDSGYGHEKYTWGVSPPDDGQEHTDDSWGDSYDGPAQWPYWDGLSLHLLQAMPHEDQSWGCASCGPGYIWSTVRHYFADGVQHHWDLGGNATFDLSISAKTQMKLFTGGKAQVSRKNLFGITASATEILRPPLDYGMSYPWWDVPGKAVDNAALTVAGKAVGADGKLWLALPDNSDMDFTVIAKGKKHYDANASAQKYKLYINLSTSTTNANLDTDTPEVCVGQTVTFTPIWSPSAPPYIDSLQHWTLPDKFVNEAYAYSATCVSYWKDMDLLSSNTTSCWFVNGTGGTASLWQNLHFANGQYVSVAANGKFTVFRPSVKMNFIQEPRHFTISDDTGLTCKLKLGTNDESGIGTMFYKVEVDSTPITPSPNGDATNPHFYGIANITQLVTANYSNPLYVCSDERCDGSEFYNDTSRQVVGSAIVGLDDGPSDIWTTPNIVSISARDFVRFKPDGDGSIWVTLGIVTWDAVGTAEQDFGGNWSITTDVSPDPSDPDGSDEFPKWTQSIGGLH